MTNIRFFPRGIPRRVWILSTVSAFLSTGLGMIVPLIPVYGDRLGASHFQLGLLVAGFFAGRLVAQIPAGVATDRVGRRPVLLLALVGYAVTCSGFAVSSTAGLLIAFRVLQGLSAGFFGVAARSLVSDICANEVQGGGPGNTVCLEQLGVRGRPGGRCFRRAGVPDGNTFLGGSDPFGPVLFDPRRSPSPNCENR